MKEYIKPQITQTLIELEGMVCDSVNVNKNTTVNSTDIDANETGLGSFSLWSDEEEE